MALVQCTECGATVSDKAAACPQCGAPRASAPIPASPRQATPIPVVPPHSPEVTQQEVGEEDEYAAAVASAKARRKKYVVVVAFAAVVLGLVGMAIALWPMSADAKTQQFLLDALRGRLPMACRPAVFAGAEMCSIGTRSADTFAWYAGPAMTIPGVEGRSANVDLIRSTSRKSECYLLFKATGVGLGEIAGRDGFVRLFEHDIAGKDFPDLNRTDRYFRITSGRLEGLFVARMGNSKLTSDNQYVLIPPSAVRGSVGGTEVEQLRARGYGR